MQQNVPFLPIPSSFYQGNGFARLYKIYISQPIIKDTKCPLKFFFFHSNQYAPPPVGDNSHRDILPLLHLVAITKATVQRENTNTKEGGRVG